MMRLLGHGKLAHSAQRATLPRKRMEAVVAAVTVAGTVAATVAVTDALQDTTIRSYFSFTAFSASWAGGRGGRE